MHIKKVIYLPEIEDKIWIVRSESGMQNERVSSISQARTWAEMADFWDTHSLADYEDQTHEVEIHFDPSARRRQVNIEPDLFDDLRHIAYERRVSLQTLVNLWLRHQVNETLTQATSATKAA